MRPIPPNGMRSLRSTTKLSCGIEVCLLRPLLTEPDEVGTRLTNLAQSLCNQGGLAGFWRARLRDGHA